MAIDNVDPGKDQRMHDVSLWDLIFKPSKVLISGSEARTWASLWQRALPSRPPITYFIPCPSISREKISQEIEATVLAIAEDHVFVSPICLCNSGASTCFYFVCRDNESQNGIHHSGEVVLFHDLPSTEQKRDWARSAFENDSILLEKMNTLIILPSYAFAKYDLLRKCGYSGGLYLGFLCEIFSREYSVADVFNFYRLYLGRNPETIDVLMHHYMQSRDINSIRKKFINSLEFKSIYFMNHHDYDLDKDIGVIDFSCDESHLRKLTSHIEKTWQEFGKSDPFYSVLSSDKYRAGKLTDELREKFYDSGLASVKKITSALKRAKREIDLKTRSCLEFGCGVGRNLAHLARLFESVTGVDISQTHLDLAREHLAAQGCGNVCLHRMGSLRDLSPLPLQDFIYSIIVVQHNPPPVMVQILRSLMGLLKPGGMALIQIPVALPGYSFNIDTYLEQIKNENKIEMHALPQSVIFEAARECGCDVLEAMPDRMFTLRNMVSFSFLFQKSQTLNIQRYCTREY